MVVVMVVVLVIITIHDNGSGYEGHGGCGCGGCDHEGHGGCDCCGYDSYIVFGQGRTVIVGHWCYGLPNNDIAIWYDGVCFSNNDIAAVSFRTTFIWLSL
jgi:hypothetical protein